MLPLDTTELTDEGIAELDTIDVDWEAAPVSTQISLVISLTSVEC
jgi:hypothetical protein